MTTKRSTRAGDSVAQASLTLRIGLAFVFAYAALSALHQPAAWLGFVPAFSTKFLAAKTTLDLVSVIQLALVVWLLSGRYVKYAAGLAAVMLLGIVATNWGDLLITFRDVGLAAMSLGLVLLER